MFLRSSRRQAQRFRLRSAGNSFRVRSSPSRSIGKRFDEAPLSAYNPANDYMSKIPADLKYAKTHEWVRVAGNIASIGITDHAQHELTDIVFVELPEKGRTLKAGEACAVVESVKTASDIYCPVSGQILETNQALLREPALVNSDPYEAGWF